MHLSCKAKLGSKFDLKARLELPLHMEDINKKILLTLIIHGILEILEMGKIHTQNNSLSKKI